MFGAERARAVTWQFETPEAETVGATVITTADTAAQPAVEPLFPLLLVGVSVLVAWLTAAGDDDLPEMEGR